MRNNIMHHQLQTLDSPSVITFPTERPQMLVPPSFIAQNAPTESCRCTTRIPWYHQNPAYTYRILFALTAWLSWRCEFCSPFIHTHYPVLKLLLLYFSKKKSPHTSKKKRFSMRSVLTHTGNRNRLYNLVDYVHIVKFYWKPELITWR